MRKSLFLVSAFLIGIHAQQRYHWTPMLKACMKKAQEEFKQASQECSAMKGPEKQKCQEPFLKVRDEKNKVCEQKNKEQDEKIRKCKMELSIAGNQNAQECKKLTNRTDKLKCFHEKNAEFERTIAECAAK